ncbi:MAG: ABC transporter ATP-binding protein [Acidimicrobiia bacterium]
MADVAFAGISKRYGDDTWALRHLTLDVDAGTICCLVGPSGCGKSTALRVLAGLEEPTEGDVRIGSRTVTQLPTRSRGLGLVTQHHALLPGRATQDSIGLPLDLRGDVDTDERRRRIEADALALDIVELLERPAGSLSGGEAQVAQIARAIVGRPEVLLLDEPLARIDPSWRSTVRADLVRLQELYGVTTIWVTADQRDAMAVAHRMVVLLDGRLAQVGAPMEVYERPRSLAVARFVGDPEIGVVEVGGRLLGIRPYELRALAEGEPPAAGEEVVAGTVVGAEPHGPWQVATVAVDGGTLRWQGAPIGVRRGDAVRLAYARDRAL